MKRVVNYTDLKQGDILRFSSSESELRVEKMLGDKIRISYKGNLYDLEKKQVFSPLNNLKFVNLGSRQGRFGGRVFIKIERDENQYYERVRAQSPLEARA